MSDNLRDRIAAVLDDHRLDILSRPDNPLCVCADGCADGPKMSVDHLADAVIAALGLRKEWSLKSTIYTNPLLHPYRSREDAVADRDGASEERRKDLSLMYRYVTEWENDE